MQLVIGYIYDSNKGSYGYKMKTEQTYPIGVAGQKWGDAEIATWRANQVIKRSYNDKVLKQIHEVGGQLTAIQYGELIYASANYPLYALKSLHWDDNLPNILVTGGVHGYETSGVHGAIRFAQDAVKDYLDQYNFIIVPCVSPWGYETINRWNPNAIDPNRSFYANSPAQESALLIALIDSLAVEFFMHIDLHETTDTDNSEFRPALAARDAIEQKQWDIPDGFYLVGDTTKPADAFQTAIINKVQGVTHIAPTDQQQRIIGEPITQLGVINYAARELGLCMGMTNAPYVTTTEVYPDSNLVDDENCIQAQVAAVCGALESLSWSVIK